MDRKQRMVLGAAWVAGCCLVAACSSGLPDKNDDDNGKAGRAEDEAGSMALGGRAAGSGGANATAGRAGEAGSSAASGTGGSKAAGSGGAGGTAGSPAAGSGGTTGQNPGSVEPCGDNNVNDTRDTATPYAPGSDVQGCLARADKDFYELAAPEGDAAGGYYVGSLSVGKDSDASVKLYTGSDNGLVFTANEAGRGASAYFYWAAAPGQKYRLVIETYVITPPQAGAPYTLRVDYTKLPDAHEPDDTRDAAKPLSLGTAAQAYFFAGHVANNLDAAQLEDWFGFDAKVGTLDVRLDDVAMNIDPSFQLVAEDGTNIGGRVSADNAGASVMGQRMIPSAGHYFIVVRALTSAKGISWGHPDTQGWVPDNFTRPYKLTVTQP